MMNKIIYAVAIALCIYLAGCGGTKPSLSSDDPDMRREAMRQAMASGDTGRYLPTLIKMLEIDPDPMVRALTARYLGKFKCQPAVPALIKALADQSPVVRQDVVIAISQIGDKTSLPTLLNMLNGETEKSVDVRRSIAQALRPSYVTEPTPELIDALIERLEDRNNGVGFAAWQSLLQLTKQDIPFDTKEWEKWRDSTKEPKK
jgi:HEAT repeat protein